MAEHRQIKLAVVGLGQHWEQRYRPTLLRMKSRFKVVAVMDQVQQLATREAKQLGCAATSGVMELTRRDAVDALLLADAQWFGAWPVQAATVARKPVFCGTPLNLANGTTAEQSLDHLLADNLNMADLPLRHSPLLAALREVCAGTLGAPQQLICTLAEKQQNNTATADQFSGDHLDFCLHVMGGEPQRFFASGLPDGSLRNLLVELDDGRALQLTQCRGAPRQSCRIEVFATGGSAVAEFPGRLRWRAGPVRWSRIMRGGTNSCRQSLRAFYRAVVSGEKTGPELRDLLRTSHWQQLAAESWRRGLWTEVSASASS